MCKRPTLLGHVGLSGGQLPAHQLHDSVSVSKMEATESQPSADQSHKWHPTMCPIFHFASSRSPGPGHLEGRGLDRVNSRRWGSWDQLRRLLTPGLPLTQVQTCSIHGVKFSHVHTLHPNFKSQWERLCPFSFVCGIRKAGTVFCSPLYTMLPVIRWGNRFVEWNKKKIPRRKYI